MQKGKMTAESNTASASVLLQSSDAGHGAQESKGKGKMEDVFEILTDAEKSEEKQHLVARKDMDDVVEYEVSDHTPLVLGQSDLGAGLSSVPYPNFPQASDTTENNYGSSSPRSSTAGTTGGQETSNISNIFDSVPAILDNLSDVLGGLGLGIGQSVTEHTTHLAGELERNGEVWSRFALECAKSVNTAMHHIAESLDNMSPSNTDRGASSSPAGCRFQSSFSDNVELGNDGSSGPAHRTSTTPYSDEPRPRPPAHNWQFDMTRDEKIDEEVYGSESQRDGYPAASCEPSTVSPVSSLNEGLGSSSSSRAFSMPPLLPSRLVHPYISRRRQAFRRSAAGFVATTSRQNRHTNVMRNRVPFQGLHSPPAVEQPAPATADVLLNNLRLLNEMGFTEAMLNAELLMENAFDIQKVILILSGDV